VKSIATCAPTFLGYIISVLAIVQHTAKEWGLEKETKVNSEFLLLKCSEIIFNFLPAFYLII
jgi:hypothetical protein